MVFDKNLFYSFCSKNPSFMRGRYFKPFVLIANTLLFILVYRGYFLLDRTVSNDAIWWYGIFHHMTEAFASGFWPLWNPYTHGGEPFFPNIGIISLMDPIALATMFLGAKLGANILWLYTFQYMLHLMVIAFGVFLFFDHIMKGSRIALISYPLVLFTGFTHCSFYQNGNLSTFSFTPYVLLFLVRYLEKQRRRDLIFCAFFAGISCQHYHFGAQSSFLTLFVVTYCFIHRKVLWSTLSFRRLLKDSLPALLIFLFLASPTIALKSYEKDIYPYLRSITSFYDKDKTVISYSSYEEFMESGGRQGHPRDLANLFIPMSGSSQNKIYIGVVFTMVLLVGLLFGKNRENEKEYKLFLTMLCLSIILFLGSNTILYEFFYYALPQLKLIRNTHNFANFYFFCLFFFILLGFQTLHRMFFRNADKEVTVASSIGGRTFGVVIFTLLVGYCMIDTPQYDTFLTEKIENLEQSPELWKKKKSLRGKLSYFLFETKLVSYETYPPHERRAALYYVDSFFPLYVFLLGGSIIFLLRRPLRPAFAHIVPKLLEYRFLTAFVLIGIGILDIVGANWRVLHFQGVHRYFLPYEEVMFPTTYKPFEFNNLQKRTSFPPREEYNFPDEMRLLLYSNPSLPNPIYAYLSLMLHETTITDYYDRSPLKLRQQDRHNTAFFVLKSYHNIANDIAPDETKLEILQTGMPRLFTANAYTGLGDYIHKEIFREEGYGNDLFLSPNNARDGMRTEGIRVREFLPHRLSVDVTNADETLLVYLDAYTDDWEVFVNGKKEQLRRVNGIYKGVLCPKGESRVEFIYSPTIYVSSLYLYFLTLLFLVGYGIATRAKGKENAASITSISGKSSITEV